MERILYKEKSGYAKHEKINQQNFCKNYNEKWGKMDVEDRSGLCLRTSQTIQGSLEALCTFHNWWRLQRPLPFQERLLRTVGYSNHLSRTHRQSTGI